MTVTFHDLEELTATSHLLENWNPNEYYCDLSQADAAFLSAYKEVFPKIVETLNIAEEVVWYKTIGNEQRCRHCNSYRQEGHHFGCPHLPLANALEALKPPHGEAKMTEGPKSSSSSAPSSPSYRSV